MNMNMCRQSRQIFSKSLQWALIILLTSHLIFSCRESKEEFSTWEIYRGDPGSTAYSTLDQINTQNLDRLQLAWEYHSKDVEEGERTTLECNPIIVDGIMYLTSPKLKLIALDASTGVEIWVFDPFKGKKASGVNRGIVHSVTKDDQRIFFSAGPLLYAINALTGELIESFGSSGSIDLRVGLDRDPDRISVWSTSPGIVYQDILIQGVSVSEGYGGAPGYVRGYNIVSGELVWTFHTLPRPGEFGFETWEKDNYKDVGGVNAWAGMSLDVERGIVYVPTGSAAFDFYGGYRKGENLFANCLIALNAATGERIWHYQMVHHDLWDYDLPTPPTLITVNTGKGEVDAVAQVTKMGLIFMFDRETGEPIFPIEERPVPPSQIAGEEAWPTQPFPVKPPPFVRHQFDTASINDITPGTREYIREIIRGARYGSIYTPPSLQGTVQFPGTRGGGEWGGPAFDPETGIMYVNANEVPFFIRLKPLLNKGQDLSGAQLFQLNNCSMCHGADRSGVGAFPSLLQISRSREELYELFNTGKGQMPAFSNLDMKEKEALVDYLLNPDEETGGPTTGNTVDLKYVHEGWSILQDTNEYFGVKPPWGTLNAIDLNKGEILWQVPLGVYPELIQKGIPPTGTQNLGGPLVTKGGLVFIGATRDEKFRAFDKVSGKILWEYQLPAGGLATPATYMIDHEQYIVIAAGGGGKVSTKSGDSYVAFKLKD